ncbi:AAA family ATPase [Marinobacter koreensis]|uniref:AAA family ATPase n=1 Tax=Marinobacter koreensis TaxID=335974 RepID=A0ABW0RGI4_9GAMM|nr:AAA family ATPase [Marinobacter koreensis]MCK7548376.1 dephospho-CoA kinase [Marinobacter koreensis]
MTKKQLWVVVGGNGAGKSTFYRLFLEPLGMPFVNADVIAREMFPDDPEAHSYEAARHADAIREDIIAQGGSFCFETVFSHVSKVDFLAKARALGYQIILVVVHVSSVSLNRARIGQRVEEGGHSVPDDKVATRIPRTLDNVRKALPLCDQVRFLDNSSAQAPFMPLATLVEGETTFLIDSPPEWLLDILDPD